MANDRRRFLKGATVAVFGVVVGTTAVRWGQTDDLPCLPEGRGAGNGLRDGQGAGGSSPVDRSAMTERPVDVSEGDEVSGIIGDVDAGELLVFPPGRFSWSSHVFVGTDNWGIRCQDGTSFEVPQGWGDGGKEWLLRTGSNDVMSDNFLLENLTFEAPGRAAPGVLLGVRYRAHVDGLHYAINGPTSARPQTNGVSAFVVDGDGRLRIDDYRQYNNGNLGGYAAGESRVGIFVGNRNDVTVELVNPVLQGFPNNACYVSRQPGNVVVRGGLLIDNNVSAVRVSGGVEVADTTIVIDTDSYPDGDGVIDGGAHNTRGLWGDNRQSGRDGGVGRNVSFVLRSYRNSQGLVDILENPVLSIDRCQFLLNDDIPGAVSGDDGGRVEVTRTDFDGEYPGAVAGRGALSGSGNCVAPTITPGDLPHESRCGCDFDWSRTHPETPERGFPG